MKKCNLFYVLGLLLIPCLISCATSEKQAINELNSICYEIENEESNISPDEWDNILDRYSYAMEILDDEIYTKENREDVYYLKGKATALLIEESINQGAKDLSRIANDAAGFIDGFKDEFDFDFENLEKNLKPGFERLMNSMESLYDELEDDFDFE